MRLTPHEIDIITQCTADVFGREAVVRLFGSRTRDDLHGGDIDLHVVAERDELATLALESQFRTRLEGQLGERRIDLVVKGPGAIARPIDRVALATGQVLSVPGSTGSGLLSSAIESETAMRDAYADMLDKALQSGLTVANRLSRSMAALEPRLPFTASTISGLDDLGSMQVDSLLMQFSNLVALVQDQLIRGVLLAAEEPLDGRSRLDQRLAAEKLGALPPGLDVPSMINARNRIAHQYPADPAKQAEVVNQVVAAVPTARQAYECLADYARAHIFGAQKQPNGK